MSEGPSLIGSLLTGGIGAAIGGVLTAVVQLFGHKAESRATAADLVTHAAGGLAAEQDKTISRLTRQNAQMRRSVLTLAEVLDELLPTLSLPDAELVKLRAAVLDAKLAI